MRVCSDGIITELWSTQGECGVRRTVWRRVYIFLYVECGVVQERWRGKYEGQCGGECVLLTSSFMLVLHTGGECA